MSIAYAFRPRRSSTGCRAFRLCQLVQPPTCIGCLTHRRCQRRNSRFCAGYRISGIVAAPFWLSPQLSHRPSGESCPSLRLATILVGPTIKPRLAPKIRSSVNTEDRLPTLIETQLTGLSVDSCSGSRRNLFLRLSRRLGPRLAPQAFVLRVCQRTDSGLHRNLYSSAQPSIRLPACATIRLSSLCRRCFFRLAPLPASSGLPAISPGLRQRSILQPTVSFNSRLAPQTDSSGAPLMLALACASVCIFWLLQIAASDSHRLPPSDCPAIPLSDLRRSLYPPVMPFN